MKHGGRISTHTEARQHLQVLKHKANVAEFREQRRQLRESGTWQYPEDPKRMTMRSAVNALERIIFGHLRR